MGCIDCYWKHFKLSLLMEKSSAIWVFPCFFLLPTYLRIAPLKCYIQHDDAGYLQEMWCLGPRQEGDAYNYQWQPNQKRHRREYFDDKPRLPGSFNRPAGRRLPVWRRYHMTWRNIHRMRRHPAVVIAGWRHRAAWAVGRTTDHPLICP